MVSKREEKKKYYIDKIIQAARTVFIEKGYEMATISQIAEEANVGRGTAYLYFSSKSELFRETMKDILNVEAFYGIFESTDYLDSPSAQFKKYFQKYVDLLFEIDVFLLREFTISFRTESEYNSNFLFNYLLDIDKQLVNRMNKTLNHYVSKNKLIDKFEVEICSGFMLMILIEIIEIYVGKTEASKEQIIDKCYKQIMYLIGPFEI